MLNTDSSAKNVATSKSSTGCQEPKQTDSKSSTPIHPLTEPGKRHIIIDKLDETTNSKPRDISEWKERMSYKTDSHLSGNTR